jgi:hypothetical protein
VQEGYPIPDIVKIDVEGGECEVLKGGRELFSQAKTKLICEMHSREAVNWITDWLKQKGYASQSLTPDDILPRIIFARRGWFGSGHCSVPANLENHKDLTKDQN